MVISSYLRGINCLVHDVNPAFKCCLGQNIEGTTLVPIKRTFETVGHVIDKRVRY